MMSSQHLTWYQNLDAAEALNKLEHNLESLTMDIQNAGIGDFPLCY